MKRFLFGSVLLLAAGIAAAAPVENAWRPAKKKLIDISWNNPTPDYLIKNLARMEKEAPVNGIAVRLTGKMSKDGKVIPVQINSPFTRDVWQTGYFAEEIAKLKTLKFTRFTDNFIAVSMRPAKDMDWFDDAYWSAICNNFGVISAIVKEVGFTGFIFDPEEYAGKVWRKYPGKTHDAAIIKARERGRQWGKAVFGANPDIKIFCLFLFSNGTFWSGDQVESTLSHAFFNGVYDVLPPTAVMIEGHEFFGYFANSDAEFARLQHDLDRNFLPRVAVENIKKYRTQTQLAAPLYIDSMLYSTNPCYKRLLPEVANTPKLTYIRQNALRAMKVSDEYVWIYSELGCWWENSPHPRNKGSWEKQLPGVNQVIAEVANPEFLLAGKKNLAPAPEGKNQGEWLFWSSPHRVGRGSWLNGIAKLSGVKGIGCIHMSVPVTAGSEYLLQVEVRCGKISGTASLGTAFRDSKGKWMRLRKQIQMRKKGTDEWEKLSLRIVAPENAGKISFQLNSAALKPDESVEFRNPQLIEINSKKDSENEKK